jgi:hypothetical protein
MYVWHIVWPNGQWLAAFCRGCIMAFVRALAVVVLAGASASAQEVSCPSLHYGIRISTV